MKAQDQKCRHRLKTDCRTRSTVRCSRSLVASSPVPVFRFLLGIGTYLVFGLYVAMVVAPYSVIVSRKACSSYGAGSMECLSVHALWPPLSNWHRCRSCEAMAEHRFISGWVWTPVVDTRWDFQSVKQRDELP